MKIRIYKTAMYKEKIQVHSRFFVEFNLLVF